LHHRHWRITGVDRLFRQTDFKHGRDLSLGTDRRRGDHGERHGEREFVF
jgi:hypothetical protein